MSDYRAVNLANWNSRVPHHVAGYGLEKYRRDPGHLSGVVRFDVTRLGSVEGLDVLHLQCHIGTDTLSLARLGARSVTGLDFSAPALEAARALAAECGEAIEYVESDLYDAVDALGGRQFDLVYTGIGALCWLPDIRRWAQVVSALLRLGGRLFMREGHPVLWALSDPRPDGLLVIGAAAAVGLDVGVDVVAVEVIPLLRDRRGALFRDLQLRRPRRAFGVTGDRVLQPWPG